MPLTIENIMTAHHYTKTPVETAAAAVNAGTCLEDANMENNIFTHLVEAVKTVCKGLYGHCNDVEFFFTGISVTRQGERLCKSAVHGKDEVRRV